MAEQVNTNTSWADDNVPTQSANNDTSWTGDTTTANESETVTATTSDLTVGETYVAKVKWFNNTKGYGFVTVLDNEVDLFVHHSEIKPHTQCWRTLITGEYIEVTVGHDNNGKPCGHSVTGIKGGQLLCEHMSPYMRNRFQTPNTSRNTTTVNETSV